MTKIALKSGKVWKAKIMRATLKVKMMGLKYKASCRVHAMFMPRREGWNLTFHLNIVGTHILKERCEVIA
jgi:hypothetical protein